MISGVCQVGREGIERRCPADFSVFSVCGGLNGKLRFLRRVFVSLRRAKRSLSHLTNLSRTIIIIASGKRQHPSAGVPEINLKSKNTSVGDLRGRRKCRMNGELSSGRNPNSRKAFGAVRVLHPASTDSENRQPGRPAPTATAKDASRTRVLHGKQALCRDTEFFRTPHRPVSRHASFLYHG